MKITIIYKNEAKREGLRAGWGFSAFIKDEKVPPFLFDTGADSPTLLHIYEEGLISTQKIKL